MPSLQMAVPAGRGPHAAVRARAASAGERDPRPPRQDPLLRVERRAARRGRLYLRQLRQAVYGLYRHGLQSEDRSCRDGLHERIRLAFIIFLVASCNLYDSVAVPPCDVECAGCAHNKTSFLRKRHGRRELLVFVFLFLCTIEFFARSYRIRAKSS